MASQSILAGQGDGPLDLYHLIRNSWLFSASELEGEAIGCKKSGSSNSVAIYVWVGVQQNVRRIYDL